MQIYLTGKHFKVLPRLRLHLEQHLEKLSHYDPRIISAHVVLKTEKYLNVAEITIKASHAEFYGEGSADDNMFSAIDLAVNRVEVQLKKHREKMKSSKKTKYRVSSALARQAASGGPEIVSSEVFSLEPLTAEQASIALNESEKDFLLYRDVRTKKVNVIYKREDGQHGVVEPEA